MNRLQLASASVQFLLLVVSAKGAREADAIPAVSTASVPLYPHVAQSARVQGSVRMRVTTDGRRVVSVANLSLQTHKVRNKSIQFLPKSAKLTERMSNLPNKTSRPGRSCPPDRRPLLLVIVIG
jgi:hypothetical protein